MEQFETKFLVLPQLKLILLPIRYRYKYSYKYRYKVIHIVLSFPQIFFSFTE
jgi:hypothetical protein